MTKHDWYFIISIIMVITIISLNEIGYGIISLILLLPTVLLMRAALKQ